MAYTICHMSHVRYAKLYLAGSQIFAVFTPNDRIYEETTMYYCVGIGCPDPLGWYRDKPEDNAFMRLVVLSPNLFTSKSLDNGLVEVTSMTS